MKSVLHKVQITMLFVLATVLQLNAQVTSHVVSVNPGYTNRTFYQMSSGIVSSVSNTDWDLGFQLRGFAASITINSKNNVHLYQSYKSAADWSSMTAADTFVVADVMNELYNSDESWDYGALSTTVDPNNPFDLGWGVYDFNTHIVEGDSVFFIRLSNGTLKKLIIDNLSSGIYNFRVADVDGSNEIVSSLTKSNYQGKFFAYYSILNNVAIDREPIYNAWDLSFEQYLALSPSIYKVTGVLSNDSVSVAKAYPVDTAGTSYSAYTFSDAINAIGYDWKSYDFNTNTYLISDSTIYFLRDRAQNYWKVVFTGFGGSANGNFEFYQQPLVPTGLVENSGIKTLGMFPNPAHESSRLMLDSKQSGAATISLIDLSGKFVKMENVQLNSGVQSIDLNLENIIPGLYQVMINQANDVQISRIMIQ